MDKEICDSKELAWTHGMHEWKSLIELLPERRNKTEKFSDSGQAGVSKNVNKVWSLLESNELEFAVDLVKVSTIQVYVVKYYLAFVWLKIIGILI